MLRRESCAEGWDCHHPWQDPCQAWEGDNGLSVVSILEEPGLPWQAVISTHSVPAAWLPVQFHLAQEKANTREEAAKNSSALKTGSVKIQAARSAWLWQSSECQQERNKSCILRGETCLALCWRSSGCGRLFDVLLPQHFQRVSWPCSGQAPNAVTVMEVFVPAGLGSGVCSADFWLLEEKLSVSVMSSEDLSLLCPCLARWAGPWCCREAPAHREHPQPCLDHSFSSALPVPLQRAGVQGAADIPGELPSLPGMCTSSKGQAPSCLIPSHPGWTLPRAEATRILSALVSGVTCLSQSVLLSPHTIHGLRACCPLGIFLWAVVSGAAEVLPQTSFHRCSGT